MSAFDWQSFLQTYSRAILASPDVEYFDLPPDVVAAGWLGFEGATEAQIAAAEARLGTTLPASYRAFLQVSNGWRNTGTFIDRILPVEEIYWLRDTDDESLLEHAHLYIDQLEDAPYDPEYDEADYSHFMDTLMIAEPTEEQELLLLNPRVKTDDGEWQAWAFGHWIPGVAAYDSFQALMEYEYQSVAENNEYESNRIEPDDNAETIITKLPYLIQLIETDINFLRPGPDETRFEHPAIAHNQATADGMQEVLDRLLELQRANLDADTLRARLLALAETATTAQTASSRDDPEIADVMQAASEITGPFDPKLVDVMSRMMEISGGYMRTQGYLQAVSKIRAFLK